MSLSHLKKTKKNLYPSLTSYAALLTFHDEENELLESRGGEDDNSSEKNE